LHAYYGTEPGQKRHRRSRYVPHPRQVKTLEERQQTRAERHADKRAPKATAKRVTAVKTRQSAATRKTTVTRKMPATRKTAAMPHLKRPRHTRQHLISAHQRRSLLGLVHTKQRQRRSRIVIHKRPKAHRVWRRPKRQP
jgi:hypothetical protein